jgi:hypothetical protein
MLKAYITAVSRSKAEQQPATVLVKGSPRQWQHRFCVVVYVLLVLMLLLSGLYLFARIRPDFLGELGHLFVNLMDRIGLYGSLFFIACAIVSVNLCLKERLSRRREDKLVITDDAIQRVSKAPRFQVLIDLDEDYSRRSWKAGWQEIRSIVVNIDSKHPDLSLVEIVHGKGRDTLYLFDWVDMTSRQPEDFFRGLRRRMPTTQQKLRSTIEATPLVRELMKKRHAIDVVVGNPHKPDERFTLSA